MPDTELVAELLDRIEQAADRVLHRFKPIKKISDFTDSDAGMEKLDAICMQLIAIGESLKKLDKITNGKLLSSYPDIPWKRAMGLRDIISHHYFDVNAEAIFDVCQTRIAPLRDSIKKIRASFHPAK